MQLEELKKENEELKNQLKDTIEEAAEYINDLKMRIYELETTVEYFKKST